MTANDPLSSQIHDNERSQDLTGKVDCSEDFSDSQDYHNYDAVNEISETVSNSSPQRPETQKKLDMAFMFSDPLVQKTDQDGKIEEFPRTIDTEGEFHRLMRHLERSQLNQQISVKRLAANFMTLRQVIEEKPTILHITCHGDSFFNKQQLRNIYYLGFEAENHPGMLDKLDEDRLRQVLHSSSNGVIQCPVKLVFVSACFSEKIGQLFKRLGVPIVIGVNQLTMIGDDVAQLFARTFYEQLLRGKTPKQAYDAAIRDNQVCYSEKSNMFSCCCAHQHSGTCKWAAYKDKNGDMKACRLHTPDSDCSCLSKWKGKHDQKCEFYRNFHLVLGTGKVKSEINQLEDELPSYTGYSKFKMVPVIKDLCCCQEGVPHEETEKFMIIKRQPEHNEELLKACQTPEQIKAYKQQIEEEAKLLDIEDEKLLHIPLFPESHDDHRRGEKIRIKVKNDISKRNYMPCTIDELKVFGRNIEIQSIVENLNSDSDKIKTKMIHIFGSDGVGKTAIALNAAKYAFERRFFSVGAFYIDFASKTQGYQFAEAIAEKLHIQQNSSSVLQDIIKRIKSDNLLLILDNCRTFISECKKEFNDSLRELNQGTPQIKIIVITDYSHDLDQQQTWQCQIQELNKDNAIELLLLAANDNSSAKSITRVKKSDLKRHEFFAGDRSKLHNPQSIIHIASLIKKGKTFDEIVNQYKEAKKQEQAQSRLDKQEEYCWTTNITFNNLQETYGLSELKLLYILAQCPSGLFLSDIKAICTLLQEDFDQWRAFLLDISLEIKSEENDDSEGNSIVDDDPKRLHKATFRIVTSRYIQAIQDYHYLPLPKFTKYINIHVLEEKKWHQTICLQYFAQLSRKLMRSVKQNQLQSNIDINLVCSIIDEGLVWGTSSESHDSKTFEKPEQRIKLSQANFLSFLNLENLLTPLIPQEPSNERTKILNYVEELCINASSVYLMLEGKENDAEIIINRAMKIAAKYKNKSLEASINLILASLQIRVGIKPQREIAALINSAMYTFGSKEIDKKDGVADSEFLFAIAQIKFSRNNVVPSTTKGASSMDENFTVASFHRQSSLMYSDGSSSLRLSLQRQMSIQPNRQEISIAEKHLRIALEKYQQTNNLYGMGKASLVLAELLMEQIHGHGDHPDFDQSYLKAIILESVRKWRALNIDPLLVRSLSLQAEYEYRGDRLNEAKKCIDEAKDICGRLSNRDLLSNCNKVLNEVLEQMRIKSKNVFIFAKAFPFVKLDENRKPVIVGALTRHNNDFRQAIKQGILDCQKVVNVKFDLLNMELLEYIRNNGCRVLHISSDVYSKDMFCIEDKNGIVKYLSIEEMKTFLSQSEQLKKEVKLNIEVVLIAIPDSERLAQVFVDLGVPHVIAFRFKKTVENNDQSEINFMDSVKYLPQRFNSIYDFCIKFYLNLIKEMSIADAVRDASDQVFYESSENSSHDYEGPVLFPHRGNHHLKLFDSESPEEKKHLKTGDLVDSSKVRGYQNLSAFKHLTPFTGRQKEMYKLIRFIKEKRLINVVGTNGIGKTRLVVEAAYYMHVRFQFQDGIFMLDLANVKAVEGVKQKLRENNISDTTSSDLHGKDVLLIFDNVDKVIKNNKTQFEWLIVDLLTHCPKIKVVLIQKNETKISMAKTSSKNNEFNSKHIVLMKVKQLNDFEAVDLFLSLVFQHREITHEELIINSDRDIHTHLQQESSIANCYGIPRYLELLADAVINCENFSQVRVSNVLQIPKKQKEKLEQIKSSKDYDHSKPKKEKSDLKIKPKPTAFINTQKHGKVQDYQRQQSQKHHHDNEEEDNDDVEPQYFQKISAHYKPNHKHESMKPKKKKQRKDSDDHEHSLEEIKGETKPALHIQDEQIEMKILIKSSMDQEGPQQIIYLPQLKREQSGMSDLTSDYGRSRGNSDVMGLEVQHLQNENLKVLRHLSAYQKGTLEDVYEVETESSALHSLNPALSTGAAHSPNNPDEEEYEDYEQYEHDDEGVEEYKDIEQPLLNKKQHSSITAPSEANSGGKLSSNFSGNSNQSTSRIHDRQRNHKDSKHSGPKSGKKAAQYAKKTNNKYHHGSQAEKNPEVKEQRKIEKKTKQQMKKKNQHEKQLQSINDAQESEEDNSLDFQTQAILQRSLSINSNTVLTFNQRQRSQNQQLSDSISPIQFSGDQSKPSLESSKKNH